MKKRLSPLTALAVAISMALQSGCSDKPVETPQGSIHRYFTRKGRMRVPGLRNASGITFNPDTKTLFIVQDSPALLREISTDGHLLRTVTIENADDLEGVAYLGNGRFAVAEESSGRIRFFQLPPSADSVTLEKKAIQTAPPTSDNTGLEGVCASRDGKTLYAVEEKTPKNIYAIDMASGKTAKLWSMAPLKIGDASGIAPAPIQGHLLILSQESRKIVECDEKGNVVSTLSLERKRNGLNHKPFEKPEGIAFDPQTKRVFVCGEPDMLYIFEKAQ